MSKYCTYCGKPMDTDATFCVECGKVNKGEYKSGRDISTSFSFDKDLILPAVGLVAASISTIPGLIVSIIALIYSTKHDDKGKGLAISGISISLFRIFLWISMFVVNYFRK